MHTTLYITFSLHRPTKLNFQFFSNFVQSFLLFFEHFQFFADVVRRVLKILQYQLRVPGLTLIALLLLTS